jgi:Protein of unknown function (DUF1566)/Carboxypeptidase regulatory-like domain
MLMCTVHRLVLLALFSLVPLACAAKTAGFEGKLVDAKGRPMPGFKVVARQAQPLKGYERFETTTRKDGTFRLARLFPKSQYSLVFISDSGMTSRSLEVLSGPEGETAMSASPVILRFLTSPDGQIYDYLLDLDWTPAPDRQMTWYEAESYARNLQIGGTRGWRLPTKVELASLYDRSHAGGADPAFNVERRVVWNAEVQSRNPSPDYSVTCFFNFDNVPTHDQCMFASYQYHVLAVRGR